MSDSPNSLPRQLHPDFPTETLGAVCGAQPKLILRRNADGTYGSPRRSPEEIMHRFEVADDLTYQLVTYFKRKKREYPEWTDEKNFERIRLALINKARDGTWAFTDAEQAWILARLRERCADKLDIASKTEQLVSAPVDSLNQDARDHDRRAVSLSSLQETPPHSQERIRGLIAQGRIAEMSPRQAGFDEKNGD